MYLDGLGFVTLFARPTTFQYIQEQCIKYKITYSENFYIYFFFRTGLQRGLESRRVSRTRFLVPTENMTCEGDGVTSCRAQDT